MTTQIEALKKALGKIKSARDCPRNAVGTLLFEAEEILEDALAEQPAQQEPVAWITKDADRAYELLRRAETEMRYAGWSRLLTDNYARKDIYDDIKEFLK